MFESLSHASVFAHLIPYVRAHSNHNLITFSLILNFKMGIIIVLLKILIDSVIGSP